MKLSKSYKRKLRAEDRAATAKWKRILACRAKKTKRVHVEGSMLYNPDGYMELCVKSKRGMIILARHLPKTRAKSPVGELRFCSRSGKDKMQFQSKGM